MKEEYLSPEEKGALEKLSVDPKYLAEAELLGDSIIKSKKTLRRVFKKLTAAVEEYDK